MKFIKSGIDLISANLPISGSVNTQARISLDLLNPPTPLHNSLLRVRGRGRPRKYSVTREGAHTATVGGATA